MEIAWTFDDKINCIVHYCRTRAKIAFECTDQIECPLCCDVCPIPLKSLITLGRKLEVI